MLVSVAQVLSALELALVIGGDTRGGGVQMIRVDPMMFFAEWGCVWIGCFVTFP